MDSVTQILTQVQPYKGEYNSIRKRQSIRDLMGDIMDKHEKNEMAANAIAAKFWKGNVMDTAKYAKLDVLFLVVLKLLKLVNLVLVKEKFHLKNVVSVVVLESQRRTKK